MPPLIAVDAIEAALLRLVDARFFARNGGKAVRHKNKAFAEKESRRWRDGAECAVGLLSSGAACVTIVADREGDIYEDFACKPNGIEVLIRAGQGRVRAESRLFARAASLAEAGRMMIALPAAPGRPARRAVIALRFSRVAIARTVSRRGHAEVEARPHSVTLSLVEALEVDPPEGAPSAHGRLLTRHKIVDVVDARRMVSCLTRALDH